MNLKNDVIYKENKTAVYLFFSSVFVICMVVMLLFSANKSVVVAQIESDVYQVPVDFQEPSNVRVTRNLEILEDDRNANQIVVPLPQGVSSDQVFLENRYMDRELRLYIKNADSEFYETNGVTADKQTALTAICEEQENSMMLTITVNRIMECKTSFENGNLIITTYNPRELYDNILILDPRELENSDNEMNAVLLDIAKLVPKELDAPKSKVYIMYSDKNAVLDEVVTDFFDEVSADIYVRLKTMAVQDAEKYGITGYYNGEFYIPGFGSIELADLLTSNITVASSNRANGLVEADNESLIYKFNIPAAEVAVGYATNTKEAYLLKQDSYRKKIAEGLAKALSEALTNIDR